MAVYDIIHRAASIGLSLDSLLEGYRAQNSCGWRGERELWFGDLGALSWWHLGNSHGHFSLDKMLRFAQCVTAICSVTCSRWSHLSATSASFTTDVPGGVLIDVRLRTKQILY